MTVPDLDSLNSFAVFAGRLNFTRAAEVLGPQRNEWVEKLKSKNEKLCKGKKGVEHPGPDGDNGDV